MIKRLSAEALTAPVRLDHPFEEARAARRAGPRRRTGAYVILYETIRDSDRLATPGGRLVTSKLPPCQNIADQAEAISRIFAP